MIADVGARYLDVDVYCPDLEWFLLVGASTMGERGSLGGIIAQLEHGGPFSGVPNTDLYTDQQVGFGREVTNLVDRHRWLSAVWRSLPADIRLCLEKCYEAPLAEFRNDELTSYRTGVVSQLGRFAGLAFGVTQNPAKLLKSCLAPQDPGARKYIKDAFENARKRSAHAHDMWKRKKTELRRPARHRLRSLPFEGSDD